MLDRIKEFFREGARPQERGAHRFDDLQFAAAALMAEAALLDGSLGDDERRRMAELLSERFALPPEDARALVAEATDRMQDTQQIHPFVRAVTDGFDDAERVRLVEMLWEIIYVDGRVHDFEANLMRRIGGLINVTDLDIGSARRRVVARLGGAGTAGSGAAGAGAKGRPGETG